MRLVVVSLSTCGTLSSGRIPCCKFCPCVYWKWNANMLSSCPAKAQCYQDVYNMKYEEPDPLADPFDDLWGNWGDDFPTDQFLDEI